MKFLARSWIRLLFGFSACVFAAPALAQQGAVDTLRTSLTQLNQRLDSLERGLCPQDSLRVTIPGAAGRADLDSLATAMRQLAERISQLAKSRCHEAEAPQMEEESLEAIRRAAEREAGPQDSVAVDSTRFIGGQRNLNLLNPEISVSGDVHLRAREGRQVDNALDREFEVSFQSALDPYSATKVFLALEEGGIEVEEGYVYYSGLPGNLRLDIGKFRQQIGDLNRWHRHALPETEYPLVYQRFLGEEGLGGIGISLYTALPVSLFGGTHEVWLQGTTAESEALFAGSGEPALLGRLQNFWQVNRSTYLQLGLTGVRGHSEDSSLTTRLAGVDARLTWRPPQSGPRRELTARIEGYQLRSTVGPVVDHRYGAFAALQFRLNRRWVLGARYDHVEAHRGPDNDEWQFTPAITWWQSEFVYLRLQAERHHDAVNGNDDQLTFQVVWAMGPHKHETY